MRVLPVVSAVGFTLATFVASQATTLHIPSEFPTIPTAIDAAVAGDDVLVAAGSYDETIVLRSGITLQSESGPGATWITGPSGGTRVTCDHVEDVSIEGFAIAEGGGTVRGSDLVGGGVRCIGSSPLLRDLVVRDCELLGEVLLHENVLGAGIACLEGSSPEIVDVEVRSCSIVDEPEFGTTVQGEGLYADATSVPYVHDCRFVGNRATTGGGVVARNPKMLLEECVLEANQGYSSSLRMEPITVVGYSHGRGPSRSERALSRVTGVGWDLRSSSGRETLPRWSSRPSSLPTVEDSASISSSAMTA